MNEGEQDCREGENGHGPPTGVCERGEDRRLSAPPGGEGRDGGKGEERQRERGDAPGKSHKRGEHRFDRQKDRAGAEGDAATRRNGKIADGRVKRGRSSKRDEEGVREKVNDRRAHRGPSRA
jgi:hypothetical protein